MTASGDAGGGGYTGTPHYLLEALAAAPLNGVQFRICLLVLRDTFGWHRKEAPLGRAELTRRMGVHEDTVKKETAALCRMGVLKVVVGARFNRPKSYRIVRDCRLWGQLRDGEWRPLLRPELLPKQFRGAAAPAPAEAGAAAAGASEGGGAAGTETPPATARAGAAQLRLYLGAYADQAMAVMGRTSGDEGEWAGALFGLYGPGGTQEGVWGAVAADDRPRLLADTLLRYAGEGNAYQGQLFPRFLEYTITNYFRGDAASNRAGRGGGRRAAAAAGSAGAGGGAGGEHGPRFGRGRRGGAGAGGAGAP